MVGNFKIIIQDSKKNYFKKSNNIEININDSKIITNVVYRLTMLVLYGTIFEKYFEFQM